MLNEEWLTTMEAFFARRSRVMPANNRKQAMLPSTAEILDNPIGTACGFAMDIGKARFFFTPGVPRELRRMLDEQVIPRLLARGGTPTAIRLKRFHSYRLGESHVDELLDRRRGLVPDGSVKLGFRAHYPQIETKLAVRGADDADIERKLAPVVAEVRKRLGNFILAEDDADARRRDPGGAAGQRRLAGHGRDVHRRPDRGAPRAAARRRARVPPRHRGARSRRALRCRGVRSTGR